MTTVRENEYRDIHNLARESFACHKLVQQLSYLNKPKFWSIARENKDGSYSGTYFTEIICLENGRLFVGGDIDDCVFAYGPNDSIERLKWVSNSYLDYIASKARIGLTDEGDLTWRWDNRVAREDIKELVQFFNSDTEKEVLTEALEMCKDSFIGEFEILQYLYHNLEIDELKAHFGKVISPRVIFAQEAIRKLCELLHV